MLNKVKYGVAVIGASVPMALTAFAEESGTSILR